MFKATIPIAAILLCLPGPEAAVRPAQLSTTAHQPLPRDASELWLVPATDDVSPRALTPYQSLIDGAAAFAAGDYAGALPLVSQPSLASTELRDYAAFYAAAARLRLPRHGPRTATRRRCRSSARRSRGSRLRRCPSRGPGDRR